MAVVFNWLQFVTSWALGLEPVLENLPVGSCPAGVGLLGEHLDNVHDGEPPGVGGLIIDAAYGLNFKECGVGGHGGGLSVSNACATESKCLMLCGGLPKLTVT